MKSINDLYREYKSLVEAKGADAVLEEIIQAMSVDDMDFYIGHARRSFDYDY